MTKTNDALRILNTLSAQDPDMQEMIKAACLNAELAQLIYQARIQAGLTQHQLAERVGTELSVIARLAEADYESPSLSLLQRIAQALNQRLEIDMIPLTTV